MELDTLREHIETECEFPADHETVVEDVGSIPVENGTGTDETVRSILDRTDETTYDSVEDVYSTLQGFVGDDYVGRKHYDDRGGVAVTGDEESL